jgi:hypothetical protein
MVSPRVNFARALFGHLFGAFKKVQGKKIYNIIGQKIQTLLNKPMPAGYHEVEFNGQNLSSGIYLYRIEAGEWHDVKKMILLR